MTIGGIGSYGINSSYLQYQSYMGQNRLQQALEKNPKYQQYIQPVNKTSSYSGSSGLAFIRDYSSKMSDVMQSANALRESNRSGVYNDLSVSSSAESVATVTERYTARSEKNITLDVEQMAQAQTNVSSGVKGTAKAESDMNLQITAMEGGNASIQVSAQKEDGTLKTNREMLNEAAKMINDSGMNLKASVVNEKDGTSILKIAGNNTGEQSAFTVTGEEGAAAGIRQEQTEALDAKYSVTENGRTNHYTSATNNVNVDSFRIGVNLKGTGTTEISVGADKDKIVSAVEKFVDDYNDTLKLLNDNADRGGGVTRQLRNMVNGITSEKSLNMVGISTQKDGTLKVDSDALKKSLAENPDLTRDIIGGSYGIGQRGFQRASNAMTADTSSLLENDFRQMESDLMNSPVYFMNNFSKSGSQNLNNYYALGMMMDFFA